MKKHILNRPMFRQVKSPAYGTGIAANLVTEQQRIKYNSGGRVGYDNGGGIFPVGGKMHRFAESPFGGGLMYGIPGALADFAYTPINQIGRMFGFNPGLSARKDIRAQKDYLFGKDREGRMTDEEVDVSNFFLPFSAKSWRDEVGEEKEKIKDVDEFLQERQNKLNQLRTTDQKPPKVVDTEIVEEESDVLGLDPEDRAAMEASILSKMGQGALTSKGTSGWDVVKDALAGATGEISKQTDPREYRKWKTRGKEQRQIREEDRKWAEKQEAKKIARAQDPANIAQVLEFEGNLSHVAAINKAYGSNIKEKPPAGKENKKQVEQFRLTLKEGDVFFDPDTNKYKMVTGNKEKPLEELSETEAIEITRRTG
jgi:hypothetical protein